MSHSGWQPILRESTQAPRTIANGAGTSADACVSATTAGGFDPESDYQWSGTFKWLSTNMSLQVLMKEPMDNPLASTWPRVLSLDTIPDKPSMMEVQKWMMRTKAVMVRFEPESESDEYKFVQLAKDLGERKCYAVASWEIPGRGRPPLNLLLMSSGRQHLLGAAFPTSAMPLRVIHF